MFLHVTDFIQLIFGNFVTHGADKKLHMSFWTNLSVMLMVNMCHYGRIEILMPYFWGFIKLSVLTR